VLLPCFFSRITLPSHTKVRWESTTVRIIDRYRQANRRRLVRCPAPNKSSTQSATVVYCRTATPIPIPTPPFLFFGTPFSPKLVGQTNTRDGTHATPTLLLLFGSRLFANPPKPSREDRAAMADSAGDTHKDRPSTRACAYCNRSKTKCLWTAEPGAGSCQRCAMHYSIPVHLLGCLGPFLTVTAMA